MYNLPYFFFFFNLNCLDATSTLNILHSFIVSIQCIWKFNFFFKLLKEFKYPISGRID